MELIKQYIDKQIDANRGKNLLYNQIDTSMGFIPGTDATMRQVPDLDEETKQELLTYVTDKALEEFCRVNQYYAFDTNARGELREIYSDLFDAIAKEQSPSATVNIRSLSIMHYQKLKQWLIKTNAFAEKMYSSDEESVCNVPCDEYSPAIQTDLLQIDLSQLLEPILDIGCGKSGELVAYFRKSGYEAYGIDRFVSENKFCQKSDWLEFDYGTTRWGTIVSNLGFSNHFKHHHLRADGNYIAYAKKYMAILGSLKIGGKFYYAPDLPFIEEYLDTTKYSIQKSAVGASHQQAAIITRM